MAMCKFWKLIRIILALVLKCVTLYIMMNKIKRIQNKEINIIKQNNVTNFMILKHFINERRSTNEIR